MELQGENVRLTSSEAQWVQETCLTPTSRGIPELGRRVIEARIAYATAHGEKIDQAAVDTLDHPMDWPKVLSAYARLNRLGRTLLTIEALHGTRADNNEEHIIEVPMSPREQAWLLAAAEIDYEVAHERVTDTDRINAEDRAIMAGVPEELFEIDAMSIDQSFALHDMLNDPDFIKKHEEEQLFEAVRILGLTAGIIRALRATADHPPDHTV